MANDANDACPDENALIEYAEALERGSSAAIEHHLDRCIPCRRAIAEIAHSLRSDATHPHAVSGAAGPLAPGCRVGRYTIVRALGHGGMGQVYEARDADLDRSVALKFLRITTNDPTYQAHVDRLSGEGRALARLTHPNVVGVYEVGEHEGRPFVVMEYVSGRSLGAWSRSRPPHPAIIDVLMEAAEGLSALHESGLIHRDFKPDNVMIGLDDGRIGRVRVVDLGLARETASATHSGGHRPEIRGPSHVTSPLAGTPAYMAPEQLAGESPTVASDIYAFCATAIEAVTGVRHGGADLPPVASKLEPLMRVFVRGLSTDPRQRFATMRALIDAVKRIRNRRRRAVKLVTLAAAGALGATGTGLALLAARPDPTLNEGCAGLERELPELDAWNDARRRGAQRIFAESSLSFAPAAWTKVDAHLTGYAASWQARRDDLCQLAGSGTLDLQRAQAKLDCLDALAQQLDKATADLLITSQTLSTSTAMVYRVPAPGSCWADPPPEVPPADLAAQLEEFLAQWEAQMATTTGTPDYAQLIAMATAVEQQAAAAGVASIRATPMHTWARTRRPARRGSRRWKSRRASAVQTIPRLPSSKRCSARSHPPYGSNFFRLWRMRLSSAISLAAYASGLPRGRCLRINASIEARALLPAS